MYLWIVITFDKELTGTKYQSNTVIKQEGSSLYAFNILKTTKNKHHIDVELKNR